MELGGRRVLVIGAGRTGLAVSRIVAGRGGGVRLTDRRSGAASARDLDGLGPGVEWRPGEEDVALLDGIDLVVPSPGVPATATILREAVARKLPVVSEIELAARLLHCPIVAITGTNGKSTTTTLIGNMLAEAGHRTFVGGNLGVPLIEAVEQGCAIAVAEVSSFQLEWVQRFRPLIGVLLNVSPDHLDRHGSMRDYVQAKVRLFAAQGETDVAVLNRDDPVVWEQRTALRARVVSIGRDDHGPTCGARVRGSDIVYRDAEGETAFSLARTRLQGWHHVEDMMAAVTTARLCGVPPDAMQSVLDRFPGLPHRCEFVGETHGVRCYDDSKATNVGAVMKSLHGFSGRVVLVAGGLDKRADFAALRPLVAERVRVVVAYGVARHRIAAGLVGAVPVECVEPFAEAVRRGIEVAEPGDTLLLSPACASFDQFADYAERGRTFRALVLRHSAAGSEAAAARGGET